MFDPGLLLALNQVPYSLPPQPVIPIEEVLRSPRAAYAEKHVTGMVEAAQGQFRQWRVGMDGLISQLWGAGPPGLGWRRPHYARSDHRHA